MYKRQGLDEQAVAAGVALAAVDGGERYWHPRRGGEDTGAMVVEDLLPVLREHGCLLYTSRCV